MTHGSEGKHKTAAITKGRKETVKRFWYLSQIQLFRYQDAWNGHCSWVSSDKKHGNHHLNTFDQDIFYGQNVAQTKMRFLYCEMLPFPTKHYLFVPIVQFWTRKFTFCFSRRLERTSEPFKLVLSSLSSCPSASLFTSSSHSFSPSFYTD